MARDGSWASARDVMENILPNMYMKRAARIAAQARAAGVAAAAGPAALPLSYEVADVRAAFENILGDRVLQIDNLDTLMAAVNASRDAAAAAGQAGGSGSPDAPSGLVVIDFFAEWSVPSFPLTLSPLLPAFVSHSSLRLPAAAVSLSPVAAIARSHAAASSPLLGALLPSTAPPFILPPLAPPLARSLMPPWLLFSIAPAHLCLLSWNPAQLGPRLIRLHFRSPVVVDTAVP